MCRYRYETICSVDLAISYLNMTTNVFIYFNFGDFDWTVTGNDVEKEGVRSWNDPNRVQTQVTQTQAIMSEHAKVYNCGLYDIYS